MGAYTPKKVQSSLEQKYKPIRKYYDDFYGEITILQNKESSEKVVKVEKTISADKSISHYVEERLNKNYKLLVNLKQCYRFPVNLCSNHQMCIFVMQYHDGTLYQEISRRQSLNMPFNYDELVILFYSIVQAVKIIVQLQSIFKSKALISNSSFLYINPSQVKILEQFFCLKKDPTVVQFQKIPTHQQIQTREYYISPESFNLLCRKQKFKAKQVSLTTQSLIFSLGMNFLECALLADLSQLYSKDSREFHYEKLKQILTQVQQQYGDNISRLIQKMTEISAGRRPSVKDVQQYLKYIIQSSSLKLNQYQPFTFEVNR